MKTYWLNGKEEENEEYEDEGLGLLHPREASTQTSRSVDGMSGSSSRRRRRRRTDEDGGSSSGGSSSSRSNVDKPDLIQDIRKMVQQQLEQQQQQQRMNVFVNECSEEKMIRAVAKK